MTASPEPMQVVAGILVTGGRVLLSQRTPEQSFPLCWEFPGGKVEEGESPQTALIREFEEEMGFGIRVLDPYAEVSYARPGGLPVRVCFYFVECAWGAPRPVEVAAVEWVELSDLGSWDLLPTNMEVAERLSRGSAGEGMERGEAER